MHGPLVLLDSGPIRLPVLTMSEEYLTAFRGSFTSALRWHHLDALWQVMRDAPSDDWYVYAVGEPPPEQPLPHAELVRFTEEIDRLLHEDHEEDYCGIVYADNLSDPAFIKIYDPHNLGVVCGYSENPPLPGWVLSKIKPCDLPAAQPANRNRRHWWQRLFGT